MLTLEVTLNGKKLALAGAQDLGVLNAIINAVGKLGEHSEGKAGKKTNYDLSLHVGGLTSRSKGQTNEHLNWVHQHPLSVGDEVIVKIGETQTADHYKNSKVAKIPVG